MTRKYFGKMAGKTNAAQTMSSSTPPSTRTPYSTAPGAKLMAMGEAANSESFNRALAAIQANVESIYSVLDAPALRDEVIVGKTVDGGNTYGANSLSNHASSSAVFDLAEMDSSDNVPVYWVHVGLAYAKLNEVLAVYRNVTPGEYVAPTIGLVGSSSKLYLYSVGTQLDISTFVSYFPEQSYATTSPHALPDKIPAITPVATALLPYSGTTYTATDVSFDGDGAILGGITWRSLYARPGCFVFIGSARTNDGLYQIAALPGGDGKKAVLTTAGAHHVLVDTLTGITAGSRVSWRTPGFGAESDSTGRDRSAYVLYTYTDSDSRKHVYLSTFSAADDYPRHDKTAGAKTGTEHGMLSALGDLGLGDQEVGLTDVGIAADTRLYASPSVYATVTGGVRAAGTPVSFDTAQTHGTAVLCSPPGFVLNPRIGVSAPTGTGDFMVVCKTLATQREVLSSAISNLQQYLGSPGITTKYDEARLTAYLKYCRSDNAAQSFLGAGDPLTPPRVLIGEGYWQVTVSSSGASAESTLTPGTQITFTTTVTGDSRDTYATLVRAVDNTLLLSDVRLRDSPYMQFPGDLAKVPLLVGGTTISGAVTFTIASIDYMPSLVNADAETYVPSAGLDAAYHNHYSASVATRGNGRGNVLRMTAWSPLTTILPDVASQTVHKFYSQQSAYNLFRCYTYEGGSAILKATIAYDAGVLTFKDVNMSAVAPLSDAVYTGLPSDSASIMAALHRPALFEYSSGVVRVRSYEAVASTAKFVFPSSGITGASKRFQFDADTGAFRAGSASATQWDTAGANSACFGGDNSAPEIGATAVGSGNTASGRNSLVGGDSSVASGLRSFGFGYGSAPAGDDSIALGGKEGSYGPRTATGTTGGVAVGSGSQSAANHGMALGHSSYAGAVESLALMGGYANEAFSAAMGPFARSASQGEFARAGCYTGSGYYQHQHGEFIVQAETTNNTTITACTDVVDGSGASPYFSHDASYRLQFHVVLRTATGMKTMTGAGAVCYYSGAYHVTNNSLTTELALGEDLAIATVALAIVDNVPKIRVTGMNGKSISWTIRLDYVLAG